MSWLAVTIPWNINDACEMFCKIYYNGIYWPHGPFPCLIRDKAALIFFFNLNSFTQTLLNVYYFEREYMFGDLNVFEKPEVVGGFIFFVFFLFCCCIFADMFC